MTSFFFHTCFLISLTVPTRTVRVPGYVVHGMNTFNSQLLTNFTQTSQIFSSLPPLPEIGLFEPSSVNSSKITSASAPHALLATFDSYIQRSIFGTPEGLTPANVLLAKTPTLSASSLDIFDRVTPRPYSDSANPTDFADPFLSKHANPLITLGDWNKAAGRLSVKCNQNGESRARIQLKNGLPNAVYTLWDLGVTDALTVNEKYSWGAFGGLPNVMTTDRHGKGRIERSMKYCPLTPCVASRRCSIIISLFYHFDHLVYAGAAALDLGGLATGLVASEQIEFFVNGDPLGPPQNEF